MTYGKVDEHEIPLKPKAGWYFVQIDKGLYCCGNPHRNGTKAAKKYEEKWLKEHPLETRIVESKAKLYQAFNGSYYWSQNALLCCYGGYKIKVVGARRMPESIQKVF